MSTLKRSQAASLLDQIRVIVASGKDETAERIRDLLASEPYENGKGGIPSIPNLEPCQGEAHSNPHIDGCGRCLHGPAWGWVGPKVTVR